MVHQELFDCIGITGGVKLSPPNVNKKSTEIEACYICGFEATKRAVHTQGIAVCPDCTKRIVRNYISELFDKD